MAKRGMFVDQMRRGGGERSAADCPSLGHSHPFVLSLPVPSSPSLNYLLFCSSFVTSFSNKLGKFGHFAFLCSFPSLFPPTVCPSLTLPFSLSPFFAMCRRPLLLILSFVVLSEYCRAKNAEENTRHLDNDLTKRQAGFGVPSAYGPCAPAHGPVGCAPPIAALPPPPLAPVPPPPPAPAGRLIPQALPGAPCEPGVECTGGSVCSMGICLCPPELVQEGTVCVSRTIYGVVPPPGGPPPLPAAPAYAPPPPAPVVQFAPAPFPSSGVPAFPMAAAPPPLPACPPPFRAACVARRTEPRSETKETKKIKMATKSEKRPFPSKNHTIPPLPAPQQQQQQQPEEEDILYALTDDDPNPTNSNSIEQSVEWSTKRRR